LEATVAKKPVSYLAGSMVVGTAIGALVGMLVAPRSGRDTRLKIKTRASEAPAYLATQVKELPERGKEALKGLPAKLRRRGRDEVGAGPIPGTAPLDAPDEVPTPDSAAAPGNQDS
jgi:hypothetical protein